MLKHWERLGDDVSHRYRPRCAESTNAFRAGSFGPDLGYFPGGHRFISDLAHCIRSGELVRRLLATASTGVERCFAAGWLTHVLADLLIHPAVAEGVGKLVTGDRCSPMDGASQPAAHLRVEIGLDAWFASEDVEEPPLRPVFDDATVSYLSNAYRHVYGIEVTAEQFLSSQRAALRGAAVAIRTVGWLGRTARRPRGRPLSCMATLSLKGVRALSASVGLRPLGLAMLAPRLPDPWLVEHTQRCLAALPELADRHLGTGASELGNYNLDTGREESASRDHETTRNVLRRLGWAA